ncbi:MAG: NAD/NADP octopine/nopaline dehydrogenase family protein [Bacillota bacterium]
MRVAVCGGGRGGLSMAADLTFAGHEVSLFQVPEYGDTIKPIFAQGGIQITGATFSGKTGVVMPKRVTTDAKEAVSDAEIVMIAVPANGHEAFFRAIGPHLCDGQVVVVNTGYWASLRFLPLLERLGKNVIIAETELLVYLCRVVGPGQVHVDATKREVNVAAMPAKLNETVLSALRKLYPQFKAADSILEINFYNLNPFVHTPIALLNTGRIEGLGGAPYPFYREGATERVCRVIEEVDREKLAVAEALGIKVESVLERIIGMYGHVGARGQSVYEAFKTDRAAQEFVFDPAVSTFYIAEEDIPFGLIPIVSLGEQLGVEAGVIRSLVLLAGLINGKDYWAEGATAERLGLAGMTAKEIVEYVRVGRKG